MKLYYFTPDEFNCDCGCGLGYKDMDKSFLMILDKIRLFAGIVFTINSSIRCKEYNKTVSKSSDSAHLKGLAVDILCLNSDTRYKIINAVMDVNILSRIGIGEKFIHLDDDTTKPQKLIWTY